MSRYVYLGDAWTDPRFKGAPCDPVRDSRGKCIVSIRMATALVEFQSGERAVVKRRRLRLRPAASPAAPARPDAFDPNDPNEQETP